VEQLVVNSLGFGARRDPKLVAKEHTKGGVHAEGFGNIALTRERLHQNLISGLPERDQTDELAPGPDRSWKLSPTSSQRSGCVCFECTQSDIGQQMALLIDPGFFRPWKELAFGNEQSDKRRAPRTFPLAEGDLGLRLVHGPSCGFYVDAGINLQLYPQARPTVDDPRSEKLAQF
jgi:hypothetical protein